MTIRLVAFAKRDDTALETLGEADLADPSEADLHAAVSEVFAAIPKGTVHRLLMLSLPGTSQVVTVDDLGETEGEPLWSRYRALAKESADISKERLKDYAGPLLDDPDATEADRETLRRLLRPGELTADTIRVIRNLAPEGYDELAPKHGWPRPMADEDERAA